MPNPQAGLRRLVTALLAAAARPADPSRAGHPRAGARPATERPSLWRVRQVATRRGAAPIAVAALLLLALVTSASPATGTRSSDVASSFGPRLSIGGGVQEDEGPTSTPAATGPAAPGSAAAIDGGFLNDGTFFQPIVVDTHAPDSKVRLELYTVKAGDTLYQIASQRHLSVETVMWANGMTGIVLHIGQVLRLPPVNGTLVTVGPDDTLDSIAATARVEARAIADYNGLADGQLVLGQVLVIPGGTGPAITFATPAPARPPASTGTPAAGGCSNCGFKPLQWPVASHQVSQQFGCTGFWAEPAFGDCAHYHGGIDIVATSGASIVAAAAGTVTFAGARSDGGGNQVWVSDGNGFYTGYHHLGSIAVHVGDHIGRGQYIGTVGLTGNTTGSHLHFEVWIGPIWAGGYRVNPLAYF